MSLFCRLVRPFAVILTAIAACPSPAPGLDVQELVVHPAPAPRPALKYRLVPSLGEQAPGVAAPLYAQAFLALQERKVDEATWEKLQGTWPSGLLLAHRGFLRIVCIGSRRCNARLLGRSFAGPGGQTDCQKCT